MPYKTDELILEKFYKTDIGKLCYSTFTHPENNELRQFISDLRKADRESLIEWCEVKIKFKDPDDHDFMYGVYNKAYKEMINYLKSL
jgi:hypothetical protein